MIALIAAIIIISTLVERRRRERRRIDLDRRQGHGLFHPRQVSLERKRKCLLANFHFFVLSKFLSFVNRTALDTAPRLPESVSRRWNWRSGGQSAPSETKSKRLLLKPIGGFFRRKTTTTTTITTSTERCRRSCRHRHQRRHRFRPPVDDGIDYKLWYKANKRYHFYNYSKLFPIVYIYIYKFCSSLSRKNHSPTPAPTPTPGRRRRPSSSPPCRGGGW